MARVHKLFSEIVWEMYLSSCPQGSLWSLSHLSWSLASEGGNAVFRHSERPHDLGSCGHDSCWSEEGISLSFFYVRRKGGELVSWLIMRVPEQMISFAGIPMRKEEWCLEQETDIWSFQSLYSFSDSSCGSSKLLSLSLVIFSINFENTSYKRDTFHVINTSYKRDTDMYKPLFKFFSIMNACYTL